MSSCSRIGFIQILGWNCNTLIKNVIFPFPLNCLFQLSILCWFVCLFLINFQILFFYAWNLIVELGCVILWNFFLNIWLIGLFLLWYSSLSLFYSHVHIKCFSWQFFFFLTSLIELCFHKWNCYHVLLFIKDLCLQEWLKSWLHVSLFSI